MRFIISTSGISFSSIRFKIIHIFITLRTIKRIVQYPLILYLVITFGTIAVCVLLRVCLFHKLIICGEVVNLSVAFHNITYSISIILMKLSLFLCLSIHSPISSIVTSSLPINFETNIFI